MAGRRGRRVRIMRGTGGGERLRRKGGFRARIEALLAVFLGAIIAGDDLRRQTPGPLRVKEPAFLELRSTPHRDRDRLRGRATSDTRPAFGLRLLDGLGKTPE